MSDPTPGKSIAPRGLFIQLVLSAFISLVVFIIGTYFFVIPRLLNHEYRLGRTEQRVETIEASLEAAEEDVAAPAPAPAQPSADTVPSAIPAPAAPPAPPAPQGK